MDSPGATRIVFLGDSITHAHRRAEEVHDCYQLGCGYVNLIAARLNAEKPDINRQVYNRGVCGNCVTDLRDRWEDDCLSISPTFVSILVGINDASCWHDQTIDTFRTVYADLLNVTRVRLPKCRIVLMEPFALTLEETREGLPIVPEEQLSRLRPRQAAVRELAAAFDLTCVRLQPVFDTACARAPGAWWALDGIHPSAAGHQLIADCWLKRVEELGTAITELALTGLQR